MITALALIIHLEREQTNDADLDRLINQVKDPLGTFCMYSLPALILNAESSKIKNERGTDSVKQAKHS
jgi:hypothetical protein